MLVQQELSVMQLCFANATREEKSDNNNYSARKDNIICFINKAKADIISIKEMRAYLDRKTNTEVSAHQQHMNVMFETGYASTQLYACKLHNTEGNNFYNPFYYAQLFNPNNVILIKSEGFHIYKDIFGSEESKPHSGCFILIALYAAKKNIEEKTSPIDTTKYFFVESYHQPIAEEHKTATAKWIHDELPNKKKHYFSDYVDIETTLTIRVGDFNTFIDNKISRDQQHSYISDGFDHVSNEMIVLDSQDLQATDKKISHTFIPFQGDKCYNEDGSEAENSTLDYAFVKNHKTKPTTYALDNAYFNNQKISDHVPFIVKITI